MDKDPTYILWHPSIEMKSPHHAIITMNVTPLAFDKMPHGPSSFFDTLLADIGLTWKADQWSIISYRSNYHGERRDSRDWRELWPQNWRISISTVGTIQHQIVFEDEYFETQAYSLDDLDGNTSTRCIIIADFQSKCSRHIARNRIAQSNHVMTTAQSLGVPNPRFYSVDIGDTFFQLQICLGEFPETFFREDCAYTAMIEDICQSCEGITSFDERAHAWGER